MWLCKCKYICMKGCIYVVIFVLPVSHNPLYCGTNPFVVQMGNSGFYQIAFRGRWKSPPVRAMENFAIKKIFYWVVVI